jgi:hypothetical protein
MTSPPREPESADDDDDAHDLLTSPLRRVRFGRGFVIVGPLGLAFALIASLWVSTMHVRHSVLVQVETTWHAGERLGLRVALVATRPGPIEHTEVDVAVEQGGVTHALPSPRVGDGGAIAEGGFDAPALEVGPATLRVRVTADGVDPIDESIALEVVPVREPVLGTPVVSGSILQHGDDTQAQPEGARIVVRPRGRLLAGFDNELFIRVTDPKGVPLGTDVDVKLVDGKLMGQTGDGNTPPVLHHGPTDALGLVRLRGPLDSEVIRLQVDTTTADGKPQSRRVRMVSFAGAVDVVAEPLVAAPGDAIEVKAWGLSTKLAIHVDVHGVDGAFADVLTPPVKGREPPRVWQVPVTASDGVLQLEAHSHVTAPGESTAIARVQVTAADPASRAGLVGLVDAQRSALSLPRIERDYDEALESAYLDWLGSRSIDAADVETARRFLLGTLPARVIGPPVALATRGRLEEELVRTQGNARIWMRVFLLGGGALFLGAMAVGLVRSHRRAAAQALAEVRREHGQDPEEVQRLEAGIRSAMRAGIGRGFGVLGIMVGGIALTMFILERLVWVF